MEWDKRSGKEGLWSVRGLRVDVDWGGGGLFDVRPLQFRQEAKVKC